LPFDNYGRRPEQSSTLGVRRGIDPSENNDIRILGNQWGIQRGHGGRLADFSRSNRNHAVNRMIERNQQQYKLAMISASPVLISIAEPVLTQRPGEECLGRYQLVEKSF